MSIQVDMMKKVPVREQDPKVRATNFEEVCLGYSKEEAEAEASRCLNCKNPQCVQGCPVSINIPGFIAELKNGVCVALQQLYDEGKRYDHCVVIGPMIMMKFACQLTKKLGIPTVVSMNTIMVDGTGMCGACRLLVGGKVKFACVDGPEFDGWEVDFDQAMQRSRLYKTEEGRLLLKEQEKETHEGGCGYCK